MILNPFFFISVSIIYVYMYVLLCSCRLLTCLDNTAFNSAGVCYSCLFLSFRAPTHNAFTALMGEPFYIQVKPIQLTGLCWSGTGPHDKSACRFFMHIEYFSYITDIINIFSSNPLFWSRLDQVVRKSGAWWLCRKWCINMSIDWNSCTSNRT